MFPRALIVKVAGEEVTLSVRTVEDRVDVFLFSKDLFKKIIDSAKIDGKNVHFYVHVTWTCKIVFSVDKPTFDVMVSEFNAQAGG